MYNKFIGPLPGTPEEFVVSNNKCFPHIIDTKVLMNTDYILQARMKKSRNSLGSAFSVFCPQIAAGSKSTELVSPSHVKVDVEVDDSRFVSFYLCIVVIKDFVLAFDF